jgi:hypothetical protein
MVASVKDAPPEDPDALAREVVEEGTLGEPPLGCAGGKLGEAKFAEVDVFFDVGGDGRRVTGWEKLVGWGFLGADELGEEAAFGEELVREDRADRVYFFLRAEVETVVRDGTPHGGGLVAFADVGVDDVLPLRLDGAWGFSFGDGGEVVVHGEWRYFERFGELDFLFQYSLIVHGANFVSVVCETGCENELVHTRLNIAI